MGALSSLIKDGARALLGTGLVLAWFGSTQVRADLQIDKTFDRSEPWTVGYNTSRKGCLASATSDDGTTVWLGFDGSAPDTPAYVAFTNPNWPSIEPRKFYELQIQASQTHRWRGYGSGVDRLNEKGVVVFGVKRRFLQELTQASELVLVVNKEVLTRTNIPGSSDAIEKLMSCQENRTVASNDGGIEARRLAEEKQRSQRERQIADRQDVPGVETSKLRDERAVEAPRAVEKKEEPEQANLERTKSEEGAPTERENADDASKREAREQAEAKQLKPKESESTAQERASQEQAERARVAREHQDDKEQGREPEKSAQQAALLPVPAEQPAPNLGLKRDALVRAIKQELKRVGCYAGGIDEDWETAPARAAILKFAKLALPAVPPPEPTGELLEAIRTRSERICPPECGRRQVEKGGRCVAKICLGGFELDEDGDCVLRRKAMIRHEADVNDRPRVRSFETKRRARADLDRGPQDRKRIARPGSRIACDRKGC